MVLFEGCRWKRFLAIKKAVRNYAGDFFRPNSHAARWKRFWLLKKPPAAARAAFFDLGPCDIDAHIFISGFTCLSRRNLVAQPGHESEFTTRICDS